ncbi:MAG: site-specific integrase [Opitutaceae bacterium]|jgi:integrase|nr:site-specific integrase [Opitutaceae bacterium]
MKRENDKSGKGEEQNQGVWDHATNVQGLIRHRRSEIYYARYKLKGRRAMKSLKTATWSIAKLRLASLLAGVERQRMRKTRTEDAGDVRVGDLIRKLDTSYDDPEMAEKTKTSYATAKAVLIDQWKVCHGTDLLRLKPSLVTTEHLATFSQFLVTKAVQKVRNRQKNRRRVGYGATAINKAIGVLHRAMRIGVESRLLFEMPFEINPVDGPTIKRPVKRRHVQLPEREQMQRVFASMRNVEGRLPGHKEGMQELQEYVMRRAEQSTCFAEFMAYSGARRQEAADWIWENDLGDFIYLRGTKTESSRNRRVPKIQALRDLLDRMRARMVAEGKPVKGRAFLISQCAEALASACKRVSVPRLTHHKLRHYFATVCIESGVDIPTLSRWLGHSDGGTLAMNTYGHLRMEHSLAAAAKVVAT